MITLADAIDSLRPDAEWCINHAETGDVIVWVDTEQTQPTDSELQAEMARLQVIYDSQEYARKRKIEYEKLNQFELQYDDQVNGTTTWKDAIAQIKTDFPKSGE
tara:strand:+ start:165 stop:476 length:312 start_codon:yes stop_codon:yes gene_type:complete